MLTLKCALQQIACEMQTLNTFPIRVYMRTSNPVPTVASWTTNSWFHSGVPKIASGELLCGGAGFQRFLKGRGAVLKKRCGNAVSTPLHPWFRL